MRPGCRQKGQRDRTEADGRNRGTHTGRENAPEAGKRTRGELTPGTPTRDAHPGRKAPEAAPRPPTPSAAGP